MTAVRGQPVGGRSERLLVGLIATAVAAGSFAAGVLGPDAAMAALALAAVLPLAVLVVGGARKLLLAAIAFDVLLQWDLNLAYQPAAGALGAEAGLNLSITTLALAGLVALWLLDATRPYPSVATVRMRPALPLVAYIAVSALSIAVARDQLLGIFYLFLLLQTLVLFVYVSSTVRDRADVAFVVDVLMAALIVEAAIMLVVYATGLTFDVLGLSTTIEPNAAATQEPGEHRAMGTLGSPNSAAGALELLLPVALAVVVSAVPRRTRLLGGAALVLGVPALVLTGSRGGLIAFGLALAVLAGIAVRRALVRPRQVVVVSAIVIVLAGAVGGPAFARFTADDEGSASSRITLARLSEEMIRDHPVLGVGLNNFAVNIPLYAGPEFTREWLYTVHNKYLLVWTEAGPLALLAFVWFLAATLRNGLRATGARDPVIATLAAGITAAIAGGLAHMTVDIFAARATVQLLWLLAAVVAALAALADEAPTAAS